MAVTGCWHSDRITLSTLILCSDLLVCDSVTRHRVRGSLTGRGVVSRRLWTSSTEVGHNTKDETRFSVNQTGPHADDASGRRRNRRGLPFHWRLARENPPECQANRVYTGHSTRQDAQVCSTSQDKHALNCHSLCVQWPLIRGVTESCSDL
jgi:hypothetical protein